MSGTTVRGLVRSDRAVLQTLYRTRGEELLKNQQGWKDNSSDLDTWFGVALNGEERVVTLELGGTNRRFRVGKRDDLIYVRGSIPDELGELVALTTLNLAHNRLHGSIPVALAKLVALKTLNLAYNRLHGAIPAEFSNLVALTNLNLADNELDGSIPHWLSDVVALKVIDLGSNQFVEGSIPSGLGKLAALETLDFYGHLSHGPIPDWLSNVVSLKMLVLGSNQLTGLIPHWLGKLVALTRLDLADNRLFGSIPSGMSKLVNLEKLDIRNNDLTGSIPDWLSNLVALTMLDLSCNGFIGFIPNELGQLVGLTSLSLDHNQFSGSIPDELCALPRLEHLHLRSNELTGGIPSGIGKMSSIRVLDLSSNGLTAVIPSDIGKMSSLQHLDLSNNCLKGGIPPEVGKISSLQSLHLANNGLTGIVPAELSTLPDLSRVDLGFNKLTNLGDVDDALRLLQHFDKRQSSTFEYLLLLDGNPWVRPPEAVLKKGRSAIRTYLVDVRTAMDAGIGYTELSSQKLLKVVLVGSSQAGKTSVMNSIVDGRANATKGRADDVSTVGVDLQRKQIKGTRVEFYDCAGQLDYAGMQQVFLGGRALYLLVWDVTRCHDHSGGELDEVIHRDVMQWLYALHLRAPDSTVILVANKCDHAIGDFSSTAQRVEGRVNDRLSEWQHSRGVPGVRENRLPTLNLLPGISSLSCQDGFGLEALIKRVTAQDSTSSIVPPSWNLGLAFIDALRDEKDPLRAAQELLDLPHTDGLCGDSCTSLFISEEAMLEKWRRLCSSLRDTSGELLSTALHSSLLNPEGAMQGALWISEFSGQIVRVDGGLGIFMDVNLLSKVLNPILDHRLKAQMFQRSDIAFWRDQLVLTGVLCGPFARELWRDSLIDWPTSKVDKLEHSLSEVLVKLGVAIPIRREGLPEGTLPDMLMPRWLPRDLCRRGHEILMTLVSRHMEGDAGEVILSWRFDRAGAPRGLVGRVIASCHLIGEAERSLCWETGAVFSSSPVAAGMARLYIVVIEYVDEVLSVKVVGPLKNDRVWAALRFVASLMVNISRDWPGVLWQGSIHCAEHVGNMVYLSTPREVRLGGPLIAGASGGCDCRHDRRTVVAQAEARLGSVIDTRSGDPFRDCRDSEGRPGDWLQNDRDSERSAGNRWYGGLDCLQALQHDAGKLGATLLAASLTLFVGASALDGAPDVVWEVSLGLLVVIFVGGVVALCYAYRAQTRRAPHNNEIELAPLLGGTAGV